jgi:hypothetical protein
MKTNFKAVHLASAIVGVLVVLLLSSRPSAPLLSSRPSAPLLSSRPSAPLLSSRPSAPLLSSRPSAPLLNSRPSALLLSSRAATRPVVLSASQVANLRKEPVIRACHQDYECPTGQSCTGYSQYQEGYCQAGGGACGTCTAYVPNYGVYVTTGCPSCGFCPYQNSSNYQITRSCGS